MYPQNDYDPHLDVMIIIRVHHYNTPSIFMSPLDVWELSSTLNTTVDNQTGIEQRKYV